MSEEKLDAILTAIRSIERRLDAMSAKQAVPTEEVATDRDLDGQYGNPNVHKDPPLWIKDGGESFAGRRYSEATPEYLDALASYHDWRADKDLAKGTEDGTKYAGYAKKDAARARGWAKRIRAGWNTAPGSLTAPPTDDDGAPF